ncbi:MAG: hypothetical protein ACE1ZQ_00865 [Ignavibacteriaceae bacterium]
MTKPPEFKNDQTITNLEIIHASLTVAGDPAGGNEAALIKTSEKYIPFVRFHSTEESVWIKRNGGSDVNFRMFWNRSDLKFVAREKWERIALEQGYKIITIELLSGDSIYFWPFRMI